ncbi:hypothetical protein DRO69_11920 [Candidatus Bathyarchaeota archaeon]|nr:MAG: hypothetical protein DRO69_11920 [Candidatus Bathyarchaeota archaeon]
MKKMVSGVILTLFLTSILTSAFNIQSVRSTWAGTVYIHADGSIDPPDAPMITYDNVTYTLTDNITSVGDGIIVKRDNIVIYGAGYTLTGTKEHFYKGIYLSGRMNVTIQNINIQNFFYGIGLAYSSNNSITENNLSANYIYGGVRLDGSCNNSIVGNFFINNGLYVEDSYWNVVEDNTVNGKPLVYLEGASDTSVMEAGQVILVSCNSIKVENLSLLNTIDGVQIRNTNTTTISGNNITNNGKGARLYYSSNNNITRNNITNNDGEGIRLYSSLNYNGISRNNIANNWEGIAIRHASNHNSISGNNVINNGWGIDLYYSSNNRFYHNNFINNTQQVFIPTPGYTNTWDNGYPSGGNYWNNYTGTDANGDGIGDSPHVIDENNVDNYPLMGQLSSFNTTLGYSVDVISNSTIEHFECFKSNSTIVMHVSNMTANQTVGFCRVTIPHELIAPPYNITVNNAPVEYNTILENENLSIIYFTYEHSQIEIIIVPEHSLTMLLLMLSIITVIVTTLKRKRNLRFSR